MRSRVMRYWYQPNLHPFLFFLIPFTTLFAFCVKMRRWFYQFGLMRSHSINVPVIVVGNITVGGTGKTPFVIWLVNFLRSQGFKPGIISRGVGGKKQTKPHHVVATDLPTFVGDEALLLLKNTQCPVVIGTNKVAAAQALIAHSDCNIIISDDGLQHYRLKRNIEIAMVDGDRRVGNNWLLPAGPLREKVGRLESVDFVVVNNGRDQDQYVMRLEPTALFSVALPSQTIDLPFRQQIHAVAGIGNPQRFFATLKKLNYIVIPHVFPDHHLFQESDLEFNDDLPIVMTEKDAIKCHAFAKKNVWYLKVTPQLNTAFEQALVDRLRKEPELELAMTC